ncbi:GNAT family N-acetyltransferase [Aestuariivita boseongensis]|uniref:GNAT family N-acetyltransferase n=1 Tax=Aestuariivita boseongensis TaxID=1470562 RepID=UPI0006833176|nr:GNAT family N-acetyltransferase [Aestuariivita boseongensis]
MTESDPTKAGFRLRRALASDLAAVDALLARSYPKLLKADYPPSVLVTALPLISRAQSALLSSGTYYVVEDADGSVIGAGGWTPDKAKRALGHIRHLVSDDRQLRRGIARAIVAHVLAEARGRGIMQMECWSTRTAVPFYTAMGFRALGPIDVPLAPGISFPCIRMQQALE